MYSADCRLTAIVSADCRLTAIVSADCRSADTHWLPASAIFNVAKKETTVSLAYFTKLETL
jgi:hypothetical protein